MVNISFELPEQEIKELRKLQRNVIGRTDYARITCVLMLALGSSPEFFVKNLGIDIATVYRYKNLLCSGKNGKSFGGSLSGQPHQNFLIDITI